MYYPQYVQNIFWHKHVRSVVFHQRVVAGIAAGGGGWADTRSLSLQVITGRWSVVLASFLIMSAAGTTSMFGLYSSTLKSVLGYDQTTLNLLSFFKDLGANDGILPGLINEITLPWVVLSVGAVLNFFWLLYDMAWRDSENSQAPSMAHVSLHMHRCKFPGFYQHRIAGDLS